MIDIKPGIFNISKRYLRSTWLERDWHDVNALQNYIVTTQAKDSLALLAEGFNPGSGLRAWRITGDYGTGKSSFGLLIANLFSARRPMLSGSVMDKIPQKLLDNLNQNSQYLLPILVTGSKEPVGIAVIRGILKLMAEKGVGSNQFPQMAQWEKLQNDGIAKDIEVVAIVEDAKKYIVDNNLGSGIVLFLDEAGKFLEYTANHPSRQDIYLLQMLAEAAARSGANPLFVFVFLHQGISSYAENLTQVQQKEWEKIAGRFEEIIWHQPTDQIVELIANALDLQEAAINPDLLAEAERAMKDAVKYAWYGPSPSIALLQNFARKIFPLHPAVIPPLVRLFAQFGQNERSLFAFLLSNEPFGLLDFVDKTDGTQFFRLNNLYDYARAVFSSQLKVKGYSNKWNWIEQRIIDYSADNPVETDILKAIGLLNMLNSDAMPATKAVIHLAMNYKEDIETALLKLMSMRAVHMLGYNNAYSVLSGSTIDLEEKFLLAEKAVSSVRQVIPIIKDRLETRPLVARKHYIKTGNLRYFEVVYCEIDRLHFSWKATSDSDGKILVPLCETEKDVLEAVEFAWAEQLKDQSHILVVISQPLQGLSGIVTELQRWEWIQRFVTELQYDRFAKEEVSRQIAALDEILNNRIQSTIGLLNTQEDDKLRWFWRGQEIPDINKGRHALSLLSDVCDEVYYKAPNVHNELINRKALSSPAAAARMRLIERLFEFPNEPFLGLNPDKKPPEMSMYLSIFKGLGLHQYTEGGQWEIKLPDAETDRQLGNLLPLFDQIEAIFKENQDERVKVDILLNELSKPPLGVREGLTPLMLAVFVLLHEQELALYEDGTFIPRVTGSVFFRLTKAPETFEIQYFPITSVRSELFVKLMDKLSLGKSATTKVDLLDIVKPLLTFVAGLPAYVTKTSHLTSQTLAVRSKILTARDPAKLLFHDLPEACGFRKLDKRIQSQNNLIEEFSTALKISIDELRSAYPNLLNLILDRLKQEFQIEGTFDEVREILQKRSSGFVSFVTEPRLKSFCLRLTDQGLSEYKWLEALGNLVCSMPPNKWRDADVVKYEHDIHHLIAQFLRVESVAFTKRPKTHENSDAIRVSLTQVNGEEKEQVFFLTPDEESAAKGLEDEMQNLISKYGRVGLAAAARSIWKILDENR